VTDALVFYSFRVVQSQEDAMSTDSQPKLKQAVVVIHGIGEHQPMKTLRDFVDAVSPKGKYRSKPDRMSELFELRCLQERPQHGTRPTTDFYEYYWAHHMKDARYRAVFTWFRRLLLRWPAGVPTQLRPIYGVLWGLLLALPVLTVWGLNAQDDNSLDAILKVWLEKPFRLFVTLAVVMMLLGGVIKAVSSHIVLGYIADAARYLSPDPGNIEQRNKIRAEGVELLRKLHASERYFRIVVVGHSLGSVIGYDIIRHLWSDLSTSHSPKACKQPLAAAFDKLAQDFAAIQSPNRANLEHFQQAQHALWREHRKAGIPWLVTDLITLGSPLTYAPFLLTDTLNAFKRRQDELEYPRCPPMPDREDAQTHYPKYYPAVNQMCDPVEILVPSRGAPYASTRWTNLYFPSRGVVVGDLIGGPLAPHFGLGVRDIEVSLATMRWWKRFLNSHL
jgi:hypothetical protein